MMRSSRHGFPRPGSGRLRRAREREEAEERARYLADLRKWGSPPRMPAPGHIHPYIESDEADC